MQLRRFQTLTFLVLFSLVTYCEAHEQHEVEARGKKKKIALFVYIADLVLKKFFILKLVYAVVFGIVLHKAGYFLAWFASYLKEQKSHEHHHDHHPHHHEYYEQPAYGHGPYRRKNYGI